METGKTSSNSEMAKALFYEFCGTAFITYVFNLSSSSSLAQPDYFARAIAYFIGFIIAVGVSGAHFNPATSLAVFIINRKYKEHSKYLGLVFCAQILGSLAGLFVTYLIVKDYGAWIMYPLESPTNPIYYTVSQTAAGISVDVFYGRIIMQEIL